MHVFILAKTITKMEEWVTFVLVFIFHMLDLCDLASVGIKHIVMCAYLLHSYKENDYIVFIIECIMQTGLKLQVLKLSVNCKD